MRPTLKTWIAGAALASVALAYSVAQAQGQAARTASPGRIQVDSDAFVLRDPLVVTCSQHVGRGYGFAAKEGSAIVAAAQFNMEKVAKALVDCRRALSRYPTEPSIITYNNVISTTLSILLFGIDNIPERESDRLAAALKIAVTAPKRASDPMRSSFYFYIGQAFAFGVGVDQNLAQAVYWYGLASDNVSRRELEALVAANPTLRKMVQ